MLRYVVQYYVDGIWCDTHTEFSNLDLAKAERFRFAAQMPLISFRLYDRNACLV